MFAIGDLIVYGSEGVCKVEDIGCPDLPYVDRERVYYTLCPLYHDGTIYIPVDTTMHMRPVITYEQAQRLISQIPNIHAAPFDNKDMRMLAEHYKEVLRAYECEGLVKLIKEGYQKRLVSIEKKKKFSQIDERYMKRAEEMLHGELAVALNIDKDDVPGYIEQRVSEMERATGT